MPLRFLFDEDTRENRLLNAINLHNAENPDEFLDVMRVGDAEAPTVGTQDPELVAWAAKWDRLVVSKDNVDSRA